MELKHVKELMAAMGRTGTKKLMLKKDGFELQLEREESDVYRSGGDASLDSGDDFSIRNEMAHRTNIAFSKGKELTTPLAEGKEKEDVASLYVTSPMVGTYYSAPSPEDPVFVKEGDSIDKNTVVGIIEAMKVMNEVKAGVAGIVAEILVENGDPVEFGTKLFRIT